MSWGMGKNRSLWVGAAVGLVVACGGDDDGGGGAGAAGKFSVMGPPQAGAASAGNGASGTSGGAGTGTVAGSGGTSGGAGTGTVAGSGGTSGASGTSGGGSGGTSGGGSGSGGPGAAGSDSGVPMLEGNFSFFVTSIEAMVELSGSQDGFGGDFGGLEGADEICQTIAAGEGAGHKTWRAFLSATTGGEGGGPVHAIDRIGEGPWYDRNGRLVAMDKAGLLMDRPAGDGAVQQNLPNERGEPLNQNEADDHDVLTGSNAQGRLLSNNPADTCNDWTSASDSLGRPGLGHSWPAFSGMNWIQAHPAGGCAPGVMLVQMGPPNPDDRSVGGGGGYGAIYCFALEP